MRELMRDQRAPLDSYELKYRSMIHSLIKIYQEVGGRVLYSGMRARMRDQRAPLDSYEPKYRSMIQSLLKYTKRKVDEV
ncbi:hypothetical protein PsorP6_019295 [Peronosclerospora sorghi]|nr:hypothetical protein PsorP6_019295 [Peronosclerospora sorghi]